MQINCLFIVRDKNSGPELLLAWDEHSMSQNYEGWQRECEDALNSLQSDYENSYYVNINVNDSDLNQACSSPIISGNVDMKKSIADVVIHKPTGLRPYDRN